MKITIKNIWTQEVIVEGEYDDLRAAVEKHKANLTGADLTRANLTWADLVGAKGEIPFLTPYTLNDYIKEYKIRKEGDYIYVYKGVTDDLKSPLQTSSPITYEIGATIKVDQANPDYWIDCGHGINLCPSVETAKKYGRKIIEVKVHIGDIVVIPQEHNKFRVKKCEVVRVI